MHAEFTTDYERRKTEIYSYSYRAVIFVCQRYARVLLYPSRRKRVANIVKTVKAR